MDIEEKRPLTHDMKAYRKKYYEEHKESYYNQELTCQLCGCKYKRCNASHHKKSRRHKDLSELNKLKTEIEKFKK